MPGYDVRPALAIEQANTILYCSRWAVTVAFYRDTLGLPTSFANDWFVEFELGPASFLSIADASRATIDAAQGKGITIAWKVHDAAAARTTLDQRGVEVTQVVQRWGSPAFYCHDPEGHRIEVWSKPASVHATVP